MEHFKLLPNGSQKVCLRFFTNFLRKINTNEFFLLQGDATMDKSNENTSRLPYPESGLWMCGK